MDKNEFILDGSTLKVLLPLSNENIRKLSRACTELLKTPGGLLTVDLSGVKELSSTNIGILADAHFRAIEVGKKLRLKVPSALMEEFDVTGMSEMLDIQVVQASAGNTQEGA